MKKIFICLITLIISILIIGCGSDYTFSSGSTIRETNYFYEYEYGLFRGTYSFKKTISEEVTVQVKCDTNECDNSDDKYVMNIYCYLDGSEVFSRNVDIESSGTTTYTLSPGTYEFKFSAKKHSGSLAFIFGE